MDPVNFQDIMPAGPFSIATDAAPYFQNIS